jgi:hypothetical protein
MTHHKSIPPFHKIGKGYQVMITSNYPWYKNKKDEQVWIPYMNSFGCPYSILGFAINKAKTIVRTYQKTFSAHGNAKAYAYVLEQSSNEIMWKSWDDEAQNFPF